MHRVTNAIIFQDMQNNLESNEKDSANRSVFYMQTEHSKLASSTYSYYGEDLDERTSTSRHVFNIT